MAVKNGTSILLKLATQVVDGTTSQTIDLSADMIDVTTKDSTGKSKEYIVGENGGTISVEGKWAESTSNYTVEELFDAWKAGTSLAFIVGETAVGSYTLSGNGYLSAFSWTAPRNGESTWSATLQITGAITRGTVSA